MLRGSEHSASRRAIKPRSRSASLAPDKLVHLIGLGKVVHRLRRRVAEHFHRTVQAAENFPDREVLLTTVYYCIKHISMARPRGRVKTARVTVNLEERAYSALRAIAGQEDAPVAQVARQAIMDFLSRKEPSLNQPILPLISSAPARDGERPDGR